MAAPLVMWANCPNSPVQVQETCCNGKTIKITQAMGCNGGDCPDYSPGYEVFCAGCNGEGFIQWGPGCISGRARSRIISEVHPISRSCSGVVFDRLEHADQKLLEKLLEKNRCRGVDTMKRFLLLLVVCRLGTCLAQTQGTLELSGAKAIISTASSGVMEPVRCDDDGNLFARFTAGNTLLRSPVSRVSADGSAKVVFDLLSTAERRDWKVVDFYPGDGGDLYELAQSPAADYFVVRFSADGQVQRSTQINAHIPVSLFHLLYLGNDRFLVDGVRNATKNSSGGVAPERPFTATLSDDGNVMKEIQLKQDPAGAKKEGGRTNAGEVPGAAVSLGTATLDESGNIYLVRSSVPAKIYVLSAAGQFIRTLTVDSPLENAELGRVRVNGRQLVAQFFRPTKGDDPDPTVFRVVNSQTGEFIADYPQVPGFGGSFACYTPGHFVFLGAAKGIETIFHAAPR
jgi:hypothetical protein